MQQVQQQMQQQVQQQVQHEVQQRLQQVQQVQLQQQLQMQQQMVAQQKALQAQHASMPGSSLFNEPPPATAVTEAASVAFATTSAGVGTKQPAPYDGSADADARELKRLCVD